MKKIILALSLATLVILSPLVAVNAECNCQNSQRGTISTNYTSEIEVSPDVVEVSIAVKTSDKKSMQVASTKNKEISNKIYEYLKHNINSANGDFIKTSNYSATPIYTYDNGKKYFDKYEVSNNVIVHTKSLDKIASWIDKSLEFGATNVNSLNFSLSSKDSQCAEALSKAAKQVRSRADLISTAAGTSVTGIKEIHTSCSVNLSSPRYGYTRNMLMAKAVSADGAMEEAMPTTNIESGNIKVYANVDAVFYVK